MATIEGSLDRSDPARLDIYDYEALDGTGKVDLSKVHWFRRFLWFCSGSDAQLLVRCPRSEWVKQEGVGGIVLATGILAFLSGSFAIYTVTVGVTVEDINSGALVIAVLVGAVWSAIIFNLDRFVVSSTGHGDGEDSISFGEFAQAIPRLVMATVIGLSLSAPLEIWVMHSEIQGLLKGVQQDEVKRRMGEYEARFNEEVSLIKSNKSAKEQIRDDLVTRINDADKLISSMSSQINSEVSAGGPRPGDGPRAAAMRKQKEEQSARRQDLESQVAKVEAELKEFDGAIEKRSAELEKQRVKFADEEAEHDGLILRVQAAHKNFPVESFFLTALLIIIEIAPIFFKMMMPRGPYIDLIENQEKLVAARFGVVRTESTRTEGLFGRQAGHVEYTFHEALAVERAVTGRLEAEAELRAKVVESYRREQLEAIEKDPSRFIERPGPTA